MLYSSLPAPLRGTVLRASSKAEACERRRSRCRKRRRRYHHLAQRLRWQQTLQFRYFRGLGYKVFPHGTTGVRVCRPKIKRPG